MDPEKFLLIGEELLARKTAWHCRAAIGQAYYGVLQATARCMRECGISPPRRQEIHQKIWHDLLNCGVPELAAPRSELASLHGVRIQAGYEMDNPAPEDYRTAEYWVAIARQHHDTIKSAFRGPNRQRAIDGIREYRRRVNRPE